MTARGLKKRIVKEARRLARRTFPEMRGKTGACLVLSWAVVEAARRHGVRLVLQAGSAYWPRVTDKTDDGDEPNVFEYRFEEHAPATVARVLAGELPEMHVWAADPETGELVDLTYGDQPAQCLELAGLTWKAPKPSPYFWGTPDRLPKLTSYEANVAAIQVTLAFLLRVIEDKKNGKQRRVDAGTPCV
jgi:hypothetical protein